MKRVLLLLIVIPQWAFGFSFEKPEREEFHSLIVEGMANTEKLAKEMRQHLGAPEKSTVAHAPARFQVELGGGNHVQAPTTKFAADPREAWDVDSENLRRVAEEVETITAE